MVSSRPVCPWATRSKFWLGTAYHPLPLPRCAIRRVDTQSRRSAIGKSKMSCVEWPGTSLAFLQVSGILVISNQSINQLHGTTPQSVVLLSDVLLSNYPMDTVPSYYLTISLSSSFLLYCPPSSYPPIRPRAVQDLTEIGVSSVKNAHL
jgi:hypothetical protein